MLIEYSKISDLLINIAGSVGEIAADRSLPQIRKKTEEIVEKLQTDTFYIAAFGGFSSGKSTFFNALLGEKIFPSLSTPTTATINFLTYGESRKLLVNYKTKDELESGRDTGLAEYKDLNMEESRAGTSIEMGLEALRNVSKESADSVYVRSIEIMHDSPLLKPKGLVWIDTPGTDSVIEYHKSVTYSLIEKADAILFFIYAPAPFKNSDWLFLDDIRRIRNSISVDKFFFILNAIDGLEEQTPDEVTRYVKKQLESKAGIKDPKIFPISAKLALLDRMPARSEAEQREFRKLMIGLGLELSDHSQIAEASGFARLNQELSTFLQINKAWYLADACGQRLKGLIDEIGQNIQLEEWGMSKSISDLETAISKLEPEITDKKNAIHAIVKSLRNDIENLSIDVGPLRDQMTVQMHKDIDEKQRLDSHSIESIIEEHKMQLKRAYEKGLGAIIQAYAGKINKIFDDFSTGMTSTLNISFDIGISDIRGALSRITPQNFQKSIKTTEYDYESSGSYGGAGAGAVLGAVLAFAIPGGLGLLGGAMLGGGLGRLFDGPKVNRVPREITRQITDYPSMRREAAKIAAEQAKNIGAAAKQKLQNGAQGVAEFFQKECEARLDSLQIQLQKIRSDRTDTSDKAEKRALLLKAAKERLSINETLSNQLIAISREKLDTQEPSQ